MICALKTMNTPFIIMLSFIINFVDSTCNFDVKLEQYLKNEGFHRNITYKLSFAIDLYEDEDVFEECIVGLDQVLPSGVYVNPDELGELRRLQKLSAVPKSKVNIELPADESDPMSVFIISKMIGNKVMMWLPVHARYHPPATNGGYARNEIGPPRVFLRCPDRRIEHCEKDASVMTFLCNGGGKEKCSWRRLTATVLTDTLIFQVPVGNMSEYHLVAAVTVSVIIAGSLYLLKTLHEYKLMGNKKRS